MSGPNRSAVRKSPVQVLSDGLDNYQHIMRLNRNLGHDQEHTFEIIEDPTIPEGMMLVFCLPDQETRMRYGLNTPDKLSRWMALNGKLIAVDGIIARLEQEVGQ